MKKISLNLKHYSILFSICGIIFLYVVSLYCKPLSVELSKISEFDGKEIISKGIVKDITQTKYGNQIISLEFNKSNVKVFSEEKSNVTYGDLIKVQGTVQKYKDSYEIIVEDKKNINVIRSWDNKTLPISQLSIDPLKYVGINVKVEGYIDSSYNSYFCLKDLNKSNIIIVSFEGGKDLYLKDGKNVVVKGVFTFDQENFRYVIKLFDETHGIFLEAE